MSDDFAEELKEINKVTGQLTDSQKLTAIVVQLHCVGEQLSRMRDDLRYLFDKAATEGGE